MALKDIQTNRTELQEYLELIFKVPEKLNKIDIDIKKELLMDIENRIISILNNVNYRLMSCPNETFEYAASNTFQIFNYYELRYLKKLVNNSLEPPVNITNQKDYKKFDWFVIGLLIVTGELETLLKEHKNPTRLAKFLNPNKWSSYKTYISDSMLYLKTIKRNTNIFNDSDKIKKLYDYCIENNFDMTETFIKEYNKIETE